MIVFMIMIFVVFFSLATCNNNANKLTRSSSCQAQTTPTNSRVANLRVGIVTIFFLIVLMLVVVFSWASLRVEREAEKGMH